MKKTKREPVIFVTSIFTLIAIGIFTVAYWIGYWAITLYDFITL